jgi:hypothetical protein
MTGVDLQLTLCPFCNHELDIKLYNGTYGCDTGCDYVRFKVNCPACGKMIYETGDFGEIYTDDDSEAEYREQFMTEFAEEVKKINRKRGANG